MMQQESPYHISPQRPFHHQSHVQSFASSGTTALREGCGRTQDLGNGFPALSTTQVLRIPPQHTSTHNAALHEGQGIFVDPGDALHFNIDYSNPDRSGDCPDFASNLPAAIPSDVQYTDAQRQYLGDALTAPTQYFLTTQLGIPTTVANVANTNRIPRSQLPALAMDVTPSSVLNPNDSSPHRLHTYELGKGQIHGHRGNVNGLPMSAPLSESPTLTSPHCITGATYTPVYHNPPADSAKRMPFKKPHSVKDVSLICEGKEVQAVVHATIEKNVFFNDKIWTCYRRNYISVACHFSLHPIISGARITLKSPSKEKCGPVQAFAVCLAANQDHLGGKDIELVQHTAKRDKGPQNQVQKERVNPSHPGQQPPPFSHPNNAPLPHLPYQCDGEDRNCQTHHTFERVQFKSATQNNGRRRAAQQFYHLIVELYADIRKTNASQPNWVKIATNTSEQMVVRGRSPGHYTDKNNPDTSLGHNGSSGPISGPSGYQFCTSGPGAYGDPYAFHAGSAGRTDAAYESYNNQSLNCSPTHTGYDSSDSSVSGGAIEYCEAPLTDRGLFSNERQQSYGYYPTADGRGVMSTEDLHTNLEAAGNWALSEASNNWPRSERCDSSRGHYRLEASDYETITY